MSPNKRIFLNIVATYGRSLYALVVGLFCGRFFAVAVGSTHIDGNAERGLETTVDF